MTPANTPDPPQADNDDHLASGPRRNTQFGQQIGIDDTSPPQVAHGQRVAAESRVIDTGHGSKASFLQPLDHRPPPQEASEASEYGAPEPGPPSADVALPADGPSAWDASKPETS